MASDQTTKPVNRERQLVEADFSEDGLLSQPSQPSKKLKSNRDHHVAFWDSLSKIYLTRRALREFDRRNQLDEPVVSQTEVPVPTPAQQHTDSEELQRFARHGGPDLRDLRGHSEPRRVKMSSQRAGNKQCKSTNPSRESSKNTDPKESSKSSSAYDANFEQHLIDNEVFPEGYQYPDGRETPEPSNLEDIRRTLGAARPSLSLSRFTDSDFQRYKQANLRVINEYDVMRNVLPMLYGVSNIPCKEDLLFTRLESMTDNATVTPKPDFYDGARLADILEPVRADLAPFIIPTKHRTAPVLPNFFIEAKGPEAVGIVAKRQACYDGAIGARAMHKMQSYGRDEPVFDNNAYSFSATYQLGQLMMYATHITPSTTGGSPEYHMSQLGGWTTIGSRDQFVQAATQLRNQRDHAKTWRDQFISDANERTKSMRTETSTQDSSDCEAALKTTNAHLVESQFSADELPTSFDYPAKEHGFCDSSDAVEEEEEEAEEEEEDELCANEVPAISIENSESADELALNVPLESTSSRKRPRNKPEGKSSKAPRYSSKPVRKQRSKRWIQKD